MELPLMVQKSGNHQLRLVVEIPVFTKVFYIQLVLGLGISEPSTEIPQVRNNQRILNLL